MAVPANDGSAENKMPLDAKPMEAACAVNGAAAMAASAKIKKRKRIGGAESGDKYSTKSLATPVIMWYTWSRIISMAKSSKPNSGYDSAQIQVLEGLEAVRRRPGMYIGSTGATGLHHLVAEIVDNSIDEAMAGFAKNIRVRLLPDSVVEVHDDGRGIPVDPHPQHKVSALELVMTKLHAGGKFGGGGYKVSGGLHGVGASVVNALSTWLRAEVHRDGGAFVQEYKSGDPVKKVARIGNARDTGTTITFRPNEKIFETIDFDFDTIVDRLRQHAYLTRGVRISCYDERDPASAYRAQTFYFEGGIMSYVRHLNHVKESKHDSVFYAEKDAEGVHVEVAIQYTDEYKETLFAFTNSIINPEGGTHVQGFRTALTRVLNAYARAKNILKEKDESLSGDDVREGLTAVISIRIADPQFEGQTKAKLGNTEAKSAVDGVVADTLAMFLEEHPKDAEAMLGKVVLAQKARQAARVARESVLRKGALEGFTLPGKLADCSSKDATQSELYIVEGDSAGGCFVGQTKVALTDGRSLNFFELIEEQQQGKKNYCYTMRADGSVGVGEISQVRRTKQNADLVKVVLDNGEEILCTPDHKFMMRDGNYVEAQHLQNQQTACLFQEKSNEWLKINDRLVYDKESSNSKIKDVIVVSHTADVYDLEISDTHNFALASGVFVHNSAKTGRNREFQAILPLRGKILNVERSRLDKILANNELKSLIIALGTNIGEQFDISKLRYHRIVIMTDADVDGSHIRTLLLTFFYRHFPELVLQGHIYIAQPPLYRIQVGKDVRYVFSDTEKETTIADMTKQKAAAKAVLAETPSEEGEEVVEALVVGGVKVNIQRYKGLGEMNPDQLWETTMNPEARLMKIVTVEDAAKADEILDILMGSEVDPRKRFIQTHAQTVKNLDV